MKLSWRNEEMPNEIPMPRVANMQKPVMRSRAIADKIEAGLAELAAVEEERDAAREQFEHAKADYERALDLCNDAKHTIVGLEHERDDLKRRCSSYQQERDEAVVRFGRLQALFVSFRAQMQAFEIPQPKSPQYVAPNAEATSPRDEQAVAEIKSALAQHDA